MELLRGCDRKRRGICAGEHVPDPLCAIYHESDKRTVRGDQRGNDPVHGVGCGQRSPDGHHYREYAF